MLNSEIIFRAFRDKKKLNIRILVLSEIKILNETKNHTPPPPLQVNWSVPMMMEKIIVKHLHNYVLEHHINTEHQSGFQPNDSTVNQLVYIYNTIISNLDIGKDIRFIFCDISKAFDRV